MLNVLHVIPGLSNSSGPTHIVNKLSSCLSDLGCNVSIFYLTGRELDTVMPKDERIYVKGFAVSRRLKYWGYSALLKKALLRHGDDFNVIHLHSLWMYPNIAVMKGAKKNNVPYIVAPQGSLDKWSLEHHSTRKKLYFNLMERSVLNEAAGLHAVTEHEANIFRNLGVKTPAYVIPNGVELDDYQSMPDPQIFKDNYQIGDEKTVLLYLSRLHPKKGLDLLIKAYAIACRSNPYLQLVIAGSDGGTGYSETVKQMLRKTGQENNVILTGELKGKEKLEAFAAADIYTLTSYSEGLPIAVVEAMACGLPVVITKGCYLPEVEEWRAGIIAETDVNSISKAIIRLASSKKLRKETGVKSKLLVNNKFGWKKIAADVLDMYKTVISEKPLELRSGHHEFR
ncbi:glycosyltransferase [bacterium]|nr:glycosyltransferase [candidate division CSSED10-310 bacterium]